MPSSMPWVKLYGEDLLDDPIKGRLSDSCQLLFAKLELLAGECDMDGWLVVHNQPMTVDDITWRLHWKDMETLLVGMQSLQEIGELEFDGEAWKVSNFEKRQGRSQSDKRAQWNDRKQRQREREKAEEEAARKAAEAQQADPDAPQPGADDPNVTRDNGVTPENVTNPVTLTEESREEKTQSRGEEKRGEENPGAGAPPTLPTQSPIIYDLAYALSKVTALDFDLNRADCLRDARALFKAGYTIEQVFKIYGKGGAWWSEDWRGKKGDYPRLRNIRETIAGFVNGNHSMEVQLAGEGGRIEPKGLGALRRFSERTVE
jgi:hypothetical protein